MSFFSRFYDFEKFPGIPREKFPNSQFFPFPWEKNLGGKTETLNRTHVYPALQSLTLLQLRLKSHGTKQVLKSDKEFEFLTQKSSNVTKL